MSLGVVFDGFLVVALGLAPKVVCFALRCCSWHELVCVCVGNALSLSRNRKRSLVSLWVSVSFLYFVNFGVLMPFSVGKEASCPFPVLLGLVF